MDIPNISVTPQATGSVNAVAGRVASRITDGGNATTNKTESATVTLSSQAQKLSQPSNSQTKNIQSQAASNTDAATANAVAVESKRAAEATGIQFLQGESKGGRINTYA